MDGTLLDLNFDNHFWQEYLPRYYASVHGMALDQVKEDLAQRFKAQEGRLNWYCLDYWREELGMDLVALKREIDHLIAIRPHALEFLQAVRQAGKQVILVTNAHRDSLSLKMERSRLHEYFDEMVCSHDYGVPKESLEFWQMLYARHDIQPEHALLVDDSLAVLRAARQAGVAQLLAVSQPDSQRPGRKIDEFFTVESFADILP